MAQTVATARQTTPDKALVSVRPQMLRADIEHNAVLSELSSVVKTSAKATHGKQGAAAAKVGKDEGNFSRDVAAGRMTLAEMAKLGPEFLAQLGSDLIQTYGVALETPAARGRRRIRDARAILDELDQLLEHTA